MFRTILALLVGLLLCFPAHAETITKIPGKMSVTDLAGACGKAGGTFGFSADGDTYGCGKPNCDGQGNECTIICDTGGNCSGSSPSRITGATTILGLLQNGNNVYHTPPIAGPGESLSSGDSSAATPAAAASPPATIY